MIMSCWFYEQNKTHVRWSVLYPGLSNWTTLKVWKRRSCPGKVWFLELPVLLFGRDSQSVSQACHRTSPTHTPYPPSASCSHSSVSPPICETLKTSLSMFHQKCSDDSKPLPSGSEILLIPIIPQYHFVSSFLPLARIFIKEPERNGFDCLGWKASGWDTIVWSLPLSLSLSLNLNKTETTSKPQTWLSKSFWVWVFSFSFSFSTL